MANPFAPAVYSAEGDCCLRAPFLPCGLGFTHIADRGANFEFVRRDAFVEWIRLPVDRRSGGKPSTVLGDNVYILGGVTISGTRMTDLNSVEKSPLQ